MSHLYCNCKKCKPMNPGAKAYREWENDKIKLEQVACNICNFCLDGVGGECHTPGCLFWMQDAPQISLREIVKEKILKG